MKMVQEIAQVSDTALSIITGEIYISDTTARGRRRHEVYETSGTSRREGSGVKS